MNTVTLLHDRSSEMPEGLYLELMNKLKIDFETNNNNNKTQILVINKNIPQYIQRSKQVLIHDIIKKSIEWENREEILLKIVSNRTFMYDIKKICKDHGIHVMCENPNWVRQNEMLNNFPQVNRHNLRVGIYSV